MRILFTVSLLAASSLALSCGTQGRTTAGSGTDTGASSLEPGGGTPGAPGDAAEPPPPTSGLSDPGSQPPPPDTTIPPTDPPAPPPADPPAPGDGTAAAPEIPEPTGPCPVLQDGTVTFSPAGLAPRDVKLWVGPGGGGPLVLYWHGTGSSPDEVQLGLGSSVIGAIESQGGMVAAPFHDTAAGLFPWFLVTGTRLDDLVVADEVIACAAQQGRIDVRRIHVAGMSAGGLQTAQMSLRRSRYVASVATYSGGIIGTGSGLYERPSNRFPALIFYGGSSDVVGVSFEQASETYQSLLRANGNFTLLCDHGGGHTIPSGGGAAVWRFFQDHPFGTDPSPYTAGLPPELPAYCLP